YYQLDLAVNHGNSGGPVLDARGDVIGIVTLKASLAEGLGFCLPIDSLRKALDRATHVTAAERDGQAGRHRFRFAAIQLLRARRTYVRAARRNVAGMQKAMDRGEDVNKGLASVGELVANLVARIDKDLLDVCRNEADVAIGDHTLPSPSRDRLKRLL